MRISRKMLAFPVLLVGIALFVVMMKTKNQPTKADVSERARVVRVIAAPEVEVVPRAVGYGSVQPGQVWEAVAQVQGKVVEVNPNLEKGAILPAGAILLRIDPSEYKLARDRSSAEVRRILANVRELDQKERNTRRSLEVEESSLALSKRELARKKKLQQSGTISKSEFEQEEKAYLSQQNAAQNYRSSLELIPSERQALMANLASARSSLENARLDLEKTVVTAPFECRIAEVSIEKSQFAKIGQVVVVADSIGQSEVPAQVPVAAFRNLLGAVGGSPFAQGIDMDALRRSIGLNAVVRLQLGGKTVEWKAHFSRVADQVDPKTRTVGVYVVVDNPYLKATHGERPPLVKNMYCEVELRGKKRPARVVIPRSSIREGVVHVVGEGNRLKSRAVEIEYVQGGIAAIASGVKPGEQVIVTDVIPAIEGMLLTPQKDEDALSALMAEAVGEAAVR